ncbi:MAG: hypothetical protein F6J87_20575 [Spirulina sp. SIO3F2]|nr:hypothetical protein [Spirulina sp. SIO3F2]
MSYGILFGVVSLLLVAIAIIQQGYFVVLFWPSLSFAIVAAGYLHLGPSIYQKSQEGFLAPISKVLLLPYLLFLWAVWHIARLLKSEPSLHQLTEKIWIGRRLLAHELPNNIDHVIDLTCEFDKTKFLHSYAYHSSGRVTEGVRK